jgi:hypothetical protein
MVPDEPLDDNIDWVPQNVAGVARGSDDAVKFDLLKQEFKSIEFTADLSLEMRRQRSAIACPQLVEPLASMRRSGS